MAAVLNTLSSVKETTCPYCGVGCGVTARVADNNIIAVSGSPTHPANKGLLCVKGSALQETSSMEGRLLSPLVDGEQVSWDKAIDRVAQGFSQTIAQHGPDSVAFYLSGQLLTEDYYVANKLMKGFIGSANVDTNSRLCMSSAVASYKRAFGSDTVPGNYEDLECCDLLVLVGSNAAWTHPILYQRIVAAKGNNPYMKVVLIDPKRTATADIADLFLPIKPGSDAALFNGLLTHLATREAIDGDFIRNHTEGFTEAFLATRTNLAEVAAKTGIDEDQLSQFYRWFENTEKSLTFYSQGINQSSTGTDKCNAIINCHLATGSIGKPGMGPFSITGQPNAMGGREVGGLANQLAAHMDFSEDNCDRVSRFWKTDSVATAAGLKAVDLFNAVETGQIKAIWIMATNPVVSMPEADRVRAALRKCPLVVVSDCIADTDTTAVADILLPATGWAEKDGTVTNSERRISRQRSLVSKPGGARHDWEIVCEVAARMGFAKAFDYSNPSEIFAEHAALSGFENNGTRDFDISCFENISDKQYQDLKPLQWPVTAASPEGTARMFTDGKFFTPNGKAKFIGFDKMLATAKTSKETPYLLNTGRVRDHWHSMTRTGKSPRLSTHTEQPFVEIHPVDAADHKIFENTLVEIGNELGRICVPARITADVKVGELFAPIHWNDQFAGPARVDVLVPSRVDPISGQPESKNVPVYIKTIAASIWMRIVTRDLGFAKKFIDASHPIFWAKNNLSGAYKFDIAVEPDSINKSISSLFDSADLRLETPKFKSYLFRDQKTNQSLVFVQERFEDLPETSFMTECLGKSKATKDWLYLTGRSDLQQARGRIICSCHQVFETDINAAITAGSCTAAALGAQLKCGTNCGSCIPELNGLIAVHQDKTSEEATAA